MKYFIDHFKSKFFLTGSASFYLKNVFSESLAGRKYIFELFPLTFQEFLTFKNARISLPLRHEDITKPLFDTILPFYQEYLTFGGFPQVVLKNNALDKKKALGDIFSAYYQLEIQQLSGFRKNTVLRDLITLLLARVGNKLDIQKLSRELGITRATLYDYIAFLEGTYFIKLIRSFAHSKDVEIRHAPKIYACDCGLANHVASISQGAIFEQAVFQQLLSKGELSYYQKKNGVEIDFILNRKAAYEVKLKPIEADFNALLKLASTIEVQEKYIVSNSYSTFPNVRYGFELL